MTHVIKYEHSANLPYPYIDFEVSSVNVEKYKLETGMIDTGADMTVISKRIAELLNLQRRSSSWVEGYSGDLEEHDVYHVNIKINELVYKRIRVIATERSIALIGRNLINLWQMKLDGKNLTGKFTSWSTDVRDAI